MTSTVRVLTGVLGSIIFFSSYSVANGISIDFSPPNRSAPIGSSFEMSLAIAGLGDSAAPSLSTFDVDISYKPMILAFSSASYGDPVLGDQLDLLDLGTITTTTPAVGTVNLFELSLDLPDDLNTLQAGTFVLATLMFTTLGVGTSPLVLSLNALGDADGAPLTASVASGSVTVTSVPEPGALLLLGPALTPLVIAIWRRRRQAQPSKQRGD
jgi:hypothetical protein